jgi:hypothetical protein
MIKLEPSSRSSRLELGHLSEGLPIVGKPASYIEDFNRFLLEAVDDGLSPLGSIAKQAVYVHLRKKFDITKEDIPNRIDEFAAAIEEIFGVGAQLIEIQIMKSLYERVGRFCRHFPKQDHLVFGEYIETTRSLCHLCSKLA